MFLDPIFTLAQDLDLIGLIYLIGLIQCLIVLTLILLKDADIGQSGPMVAFFAVLGLSFGLPATLHPQFAFGEVVTIWLAQAWIPTLSYLLILQAAIGRLPEARHFAVLALPIIGAPAVLVLVSGSEGCGGFMLCAETVTLLRVFGVLVGAFILLLLWLHRGLLVPLREGNKPRNRYWVVLTLIFFNVLNLGVDIPRAVEIVGPGEATLIRAILGLSLAYLVTTLMFRITPKQLVLLSGLPILRRNIELTAEELAVADRIKELMTFDKPYHIPTFSRADLALEFNLSEIVISRVINGAFGKGFRRFVNEYRVEEAKRWLRRGNRQVTKIAVNVGFSRHTSFNRVFKQIAGQSPTEYRAALAAAGNSETTDEQPDALGGSVVMPHPGTRHSEMPTQGRYAEAEPLYKRALAVREKALRPEHPDFAASLNNLAGLYYAQGRYEAAEPLNKRALAIFEKALGPEHPHVVQSLENYAALLRETGRSDEAAKLEARAKAIRAKHAGE